VIVHQDVAQDAHTESAAPFFQQPHKRLEVCGLVENIHAAIAAIQDVIDLVTQGISRLSWHEQSVNRRDRNRNKQDCPPYKRDSPAYCAARRSVGRVRRGKNLFLLYLPARPGAAGID
jgi:hypothetical protein